MPAPWKHFLTSAYLPLELRKSFRTAKAYSVSVFYELCVIADLVCRFVVYNTWQPHVQVTKRYFSASYVIIVGLVRRSLKLFVGEAAD